MPAFLFMEAGILSFLRKIQNEVKGKIKMKDTGE
jgi:hypothetical protein